jgi:hypothetical protein
MSASLAPQEGGRPAPAPSKADAFVVSCIDPRLTDDVTFLLAELGRSNRYSEMRIAGAALAAVDESRPAWNTALWENLAASRQLHGVRRVIFINHRDCGAMNIWAGRRLSLDPADELRQHHAVMERAAAGVRSRHPDMTVEIKLMELDGSARDLPCATCGTNPGVLRAEAVAGPVAGPGAAPASGTAAMPAANAAAFADLVRLRTAGGPLGADGERDLLAEGVTRHGLTAQQARQVLDQTAAARGVATSAGGERDVVIFLRSRADAQKRIARQDAERAAALFRGLTGSRLGAADAERRVAALMEAEGLAPRPEGLFRSTAWHRRHLGSGLLP